MTNIPTDQKLPTTYISVVTPPGKLLLSAPPFEGELFFSIPSFHFWQNAIQTKLMRN